MTVLKNAKHERFAQELAKGKTATDAYVIAGYKESRPAASRLSTNVNIQARIKEIQGRAAERAEITIHDIATQLDEDRTFAREVKSASAAVSATMGKAKVLGLVIERAEHTGKDGGPIETVELSETESGRRIAFTLARARQEKPQVH